MNVAIEVQLALERALTQADQLFDRLDRARVAASQIRVNADNIRLPSGGGASGSTGNNSQAAAQLNALSAAIARQRATAQTAWQATAQMNATISASVAAANAATGAVNALAAAQARAAATGQQNAAAQHQHATQTGNLLGGIVRLAASYITLRGAFDFTKDSINQAIAVENLTNTLTATSGSAKQAASDLGFLRSESQRIGVNFIDSSREFVKFSVALDSAGMSAQIGRDAFTALAEAGRRMGLTSQQQASTFLALEQMISKGTVSAQELRLQLGNALPGALQVAARSMGLTTKELQKLVESGNLASTEFIPKFIEQLQKELPATAETLASTSAELSRLGNAWQEFKAKVGEGLSPVTKDIATGLASELQRTTALLTLNDVRLQKGDASVGFLALDNQDKRRALSQRFPQAEPVGPQDIRVRQGLFGTVTSGGPDWAQAFLRMQREQIASINKVEKVRNANQAESDRISGSDVIQDADLEKASFFWQTYRRLESETLDEELSKRDEISRKFDEDIARIRQNKKQLSQPLVDELVSLAEAGRENQLAIFDEKEWQESLQQAEKDWQDFVENSRRMAREAKKEDAILKTPLSTDFGDLRAQRGVLREQMFASTTVEDFQISASRIGQINQAMFAQLQANQVSWQESFTFGIDEVVEHWGSASERMANIGATVADSIQSNMTEGLTRAILETDNAQQAFADMTNAIVADLLKIAIQELFVKQIVSGLGGLFGTAAHTGGVIGSGGMTTQFAPRFHAGGAVGDEQLIMGRRGEVIFTPEQIKMLGGNQKQSGKGVEILNVFDEKLIDQRLAANPDLVVNAISRRRGAIRALLT